MRSFARGANQFSNGPSNFRFEDTPDTTTSVRVGGVGTRCKIVMAKASQSDKLCLPQGNFMTADQSSTFVHAPVATSDRALMILSHLSAILGVGLLLPFVVWLVKRREPDSVA